MRLAHQHALTEDLTVADIDRALTRAWRHLCKARRTGAAKRELVATDAIDRLLDVRLERTRPA